MKAYGTAEERGEHDVLTEKQCRVLDLLIEHKTSKEIARALGISPHTVDQRISLARGRLGVASRNELAARYRLMRKTIVRSQPDNSAASEDDRAEDFHESGTGEPLGADRNEDPVAGQGDRNEHSVVSEATQAETQRSAVPGQEKISCPTADDLGHRVGPEMFEGRSGGLWRFGAIVATALLLVVTVLVSFAIFDQLNDLLT